MLATIIILDNFSNSKPESLRRLREITDKDFQFYEVDLLDRDGVENVFSNNHTEAEVLLSALSITSALLTAAYFGAQSLQPIGLRPIT
jgi:UDP-glucose 4-epimerase